MCGGGGGGQKCHPTVGWLMASVNVTSVGPIYRIGYLADTLDTQKVVYFSILLCHFS